MERIEYFSQEIKQKAISVQIQKNETNIVWDKELWVQTYEDIARVEWRKQNANLISI